MVAIMKEDLQVKDQDMAMIEETMTTENLK